MSIQTLRFIIAAGLMVSAGTVLGQDRPNILWITIEDTSPQFIGCYGNEDAHTPNIDELARKGTRFTSAFSTNTVCSPSRTALITGVSTFETGTGHHRSKVPLPGYIKGFPYYLRQAGYYTSNSHKTDYNLRESKAFTAEAWDESSKDAGWWGRKSGQPFFAVFNFTDSHQSRTMTNPYEQYRKSVLDQLPGTARIGENDFEMPPFYRDSPEMRRQFARVYNSVSLTDLKIGQLLERLENDGLADSTIIFFFSDHGQGIPGAKTNGTGLGYRVPLIVWVPPMYRNLSPWDPGTVSDEPVSFLDLAPTLVSLAGEQVPAHMKGRVIMGGGREKRPDYLSLSSGRSDNGIDMVRSITDGRYIYSRNYLPFMPRARYINYMEQGEIMQLMRADLAAGELDTLQKSLFMPRPAEYLFDIRNDPWETRNLAGAPGQQSLLKKMRKRLQREVMSAKDVMFLPEYELTRISATSTPYEYRLSEKNYLLKEIYSAASLSGFRDAHTARRQSELLKDPDPIVRYWAVAGLRSQSPETLKQYSAQILERLEDPYPPVSITAAAIAWDVLGNESAAAHLKKYAAGSDADLALLSLNYLLYVREKAPFIPFILELSRRGEPEANLAWACADFLEAAGKEKGHPNILFILTDDLGFGDVGVFFQRQRQEENDRGKPFLLTPYLDKMAAEGATLSQYCPAPVCAPSRASLLLGVNQGHANVRDNQFDKALEDNHTLGTVLQTAGYSTAAIGKWGLQGKGASAPDWPASPLNRGFDYYYGYIAHGHGHEHYPKEGLYRDPKPVWENRKEVSAGLDNCYTGDLFTALAKKYIVDHEEKYKGKQPFFLYLAYDTPHAVLELPTQAYPEGKGLKGGLQWLGTEGKMINTASGKPDSWTHPDYAHATYDHDGDPSTAEIAWPETYKRYATIVRRIDSQVGDLLQLLKDLGIEDNTLVVFTSDNGPSKESYLPKPYVGFEPTFFGGFGPFDGIKRDVLEGGLRTPAIAWWPGQIPANTHVESPSISYDWLPTFAGMAGLPAPVRSDGVSLLPSLTGKGQQRASQIYVEYFHKSRTPGYAEIDASHRNKPRGQMQMLRLGDTLGVRYDIRSADDDFEFYDIVNDPGQSRNLSGPGSAALQEQFKARVLQLRMPDPKAPRPYDDALIAPVEKPGLIPGLSWKFFEGDFPWLAKVDEQPASAWGTVPAPGLPETGSEEEGIFVMEGYLRVPADGAYTFSLRAEGKAFMRIHEAAVIDADFAYRSGELKTGKLLLKKGLHPIRIHFAPDHTGKSGIEVEWEGPSFGTSPLSLEELFHENKP